MRLLLRKKSHAYPQAKGFRRDCVFLEGIYGIFFSWAKVFIHWILTHGTFINTRQSKGFEKGLKNVKIVINQDDENDFTLETVFANSKLLLKEMTNSKIGEVEGGAEKVKGGPR